MRLRPQRLHDLDLLFGAAAAVMKVLVEADKLHLVPADPDAEPEAPARQHVERGGLLGDEHGLALRQDQYLSGEIGDLGAAGEKAEQHERIVVQIARAAAALGPAGAARDIGAEHVIGRRDPLIADLLRRLHKFAQSGRLTADIDNRKSHPELHSHPPLISSITWSAICRARHLRGASHCNCR